MNCIQNKNLVIYAEKISSSNNKYDIIPNQYH